jgi:hypothetical protein
MSFISDLFSGGASGLVETVGNALDKVITTKEEKLQAELELKKAEYSYSIENKKLDNEADAAILNDKQNARSIYEKSKDISDRIATRIMNWNLPFLLVLVAINIACVKHFDSVLLAIISNILGQVIQMLINERLTVINFFFGSSLGSREKSAQMSKRE